MLENLDKLKWREIKWHLSIKKTNICNTCDMNVTESHFLAPIVQVLPVKWVHVMDDNTQLFSIPV